MSSTFISSPDGPDLNSNAINHLLTEDMCDRLFKFDYEGCEEGITKTLEAYGVTSLLDLTTVLNVPETVDEFAHSAGLSAFILKKFLANISTAEDYLNGKICPGSFKELKTMEEFYRRGVVSVKAPTGSTENDRNRNTDILLVLGESGIGKTFFSLKEAPTSEYGRSFSKVRHVIVRFEAGELKDRFDKINIDNSMDNNAKSEQKAEAVITKVKEIIETTVRGKVVSLTMPLSMRVTVIIDECGSMPGFYNKFNNVKYIYDKLGEQITNVSHRLILAGTGLDTVTATFSSKKDVFKYRLRPWSIENIGVAWSVYNVKVKEKLMRAIEIEPMLYRLCTNGRAARFVAETLRKSAWLECGRIERSTMPLQFVVEQVLGLFIDDNGLQSLEPNEQAWVAVAVLRELERSCWEEHPTMPEFSNYIKLEDQDVTLKMLRCAEGMVRIHVESMTQESGESAAIYVDGAQVSTSISDAMAVLLYFMLGIRSQVASSWSSLETVCALYAIKRKVLMKYRSDEAQALPDNVGEYRLVRLREGVPESESTTNFAFPHVPSDTVWINGNMAPFAGAVTHFELYQSKMYEVSGARAAVDMVDELGKCGLVKSWEGLSADQKNKVDKGNIAISCMYAIWNDKLGLGDPRNRTAQGDLIGGYENRDGSLRKSCHLVPEIQLSMPKPTSPVPMIEFKYKNNKCTTDVNGTIKEIDIIEDFSENSIHFFLCTNQNEIELKLQSVTEVKTSVIISSTDVDRHGILVSGSDAFDKWETFKAERVKTGVEVYFLFGNGS